MVMVPDDCAYAAPNVNNAIAANCVNIRRNPVFKILTPSNSY